jgi:O-antigen/teichoic acid export membrane protein
MRETIARLGRLSAIYAAGDILTRGAALLLLPLYTRSLAPDDYGIIGVAEMLKQVLQMLFSLGAAGAVIRFHSITTDETERRRTFSMLWLLLFVSSGAGSLACLTLGRPLLETLFAQIDVDRYIRPAIIIAFLNSTFLIIPQSLLRAREQAGRFVVFSLGVFLSTNLATIWQVVLLDAGAEGYLIGQLIGTGGMALIAAIWLMRQVDLQPAWHTVRPLLVYGLPLVPHFVAHWALGLSDRLILERYVSLADLGVYTLAYQVGVVAQLLVMAVSNALLPMFGRAAVDQAEWERLPRIATYVVLVDALAVLALGLAAPSLIQLVTPPAYHAAGNLALPILLGYLAFGLYTLPMGLLSQTFGRTGTIPLLTLSAAGVNIGLNLWLVPRFGIWAAAYTSLVGYVVLLLLVWFAARRIRPLSYEYERLSRILLSVAIVLSTGMIALRFEPLVNLLLLPILILLVPVLLWMLGFWTVQERQFIGEMRLKVFARR